MDAALLGMVALLATNGCSRRDNPPNVLLITVDTLRADHLPPYGYDQIETPVISRLASEGIVFEKAFADTPWTLPSLSSVMTGKYPSEHGVRKWANSLGEEQVTMAEALKGRGYTTAAIVGSYPLDRLFGLAQGFDHYDDEMTRSMFVTADGTPVTPAAERDKPVADTPLGRLKWRAVRQRNNAYRSDREVADRGIEWLRRNSASPFFLWVHFFGPHEKGKRSGLSKHEIGEQRKRWIARYDPDIEEMDHEVGRLLDALRTDPRANQTVVIFHSDHGQSLEEHGVFGHGYELFDSEVHVPLIVRLPGAAHAGERIGRLVRNLDIFATVLQLAGVKPGVSSSRDLLSPQAPPDEHVFLETRFLMLRTARKVQIGDQTYLVGNILRGIRTADEKLIVQLPIPFSGDSPLPKHYLLAEKRFQLYDLNSDPDEREDIAPVKRKDVERLEAEISNYGDGVGTAKTNELDESARERLRALGYEP